MSANTSLFSVRVASSTVVRPKSVIRTNVVRPSVGCGTRSTRPAASSSRIACVTLVTCTCSRSEALVIGRAPERLNANSRKSSKREKLRSWGRNAFSTRASRIWWARMTDVTATMPSATSPQPDRSQFSRAWAIGSRLSDCGGCEHTPLHTAGLPATASTFGVFLRLRHSGQHRAGGGASADRDPHSAVRVVAYLQGGLVEHVTPRPSRGGQVYEVGVPVGAVDTHRPQPPA